MRIENTLETARKEIYGTVDWDSDLNGNVYMSEKALILSSDENNQIIDAQSQVVELLDTMQNILASNEDLNEWLDIPKSLFDLSMVDRMLDYITTYGRFDWVFDDYGNLKLLEFNSETPMGWKESIHYTEKAHNFYLRHISMNINLRDRLKQSIYERLISIGRLSGRIAIIGDLDDTEELDTFQFLADIIREVSPEVMLCSVSELRAMTGYSDIDDGIYIDRNGQLYPIDTMMTFYSIEWLAKDEGGEQLIQLIKENKVTLMNPTSTLQLHSKGLFGLIWFLYNNSELLDDFGYTIENFIPYSTFYPEEFDEDQVYCVQKKLNHREGDSIEVKFVKDCEAIEDEYVIFQEYVPVKKIPFERLFRDEQGNVFKKNVLLQHTIGVYCIMNEFGGYYTRLSEGVCSVFDATFVPTFVSTI